MFSTRARRHTNNTLGQPLMYLMFEQEQLPLGKMHANLHSCKHPDFIMEVQQYGSAAEAQGLAKTVRNHYGKG